jgi:uncharacterized membrane protein
MKDLAGFLRTTVIGGIVFLVPIVIVVAILGKAFDVMRRIAEPLAEWLPISNVADVILVNLLGGLLLVLLCFLAGLLARTDRAKRIVRAIETRFLDHIPVYAFIKGMTASVAGAQKDNPLKPVFVRLDDYSQVAFEVERNDDGTVVVYLPGAPNPWSGTVCVVTPDRVTVLDTSLLAAADNVRHLGRGTNGLLGQDAG